MKDAKKRLDILEATVPHTAAPLLFQMSLEILDEKGDRIRVELDECGNRLKRVH